jgi:hypothetical protein
MVQPWEASLELLLEAIAALRAEERELQSRLQHHLRSVRTNHSPMPSAVGRLIEVRKLLEQMVEAFQQAAAAVGYDEAIIRQAVAAARRRGALQTKPWRQIRTS